MRQETYPNIAWLVAQRGWIALDYLDHGYTHSFARLRPRWNGVGKRCHQSDYSTRDDALRMLDNGIACWRRENGR